MKKKKSKKSKKFNLKTRLIGAIRRIWWYGPQRKECLRLAKEAGNLCALCGKKKPKLQVDHIVPFVPLTGWDNDWNSALERMFVDPVTGLRAVCKKCHEAHTAIQKTIRNENKEKEDA